MAGRGETSLKGRAKKGKRRQDCLGNIGPGDRLGEAQATPGFFGSTGQCGKSKIKGERPAMSKRKRGRGSFPEAVGEKAAAVVMKEGVTVRTTDCRGVEKEDLQNKKERAENTKRGLAKDGLWTQTNRVNAEWKHKTALPGADSPENASIWWGNILEDWNLRPQNSHRTFVRPIKHRGGGVPHFKGTCLR